MKQPRQEEEIPTNRREFTTKQKKVIMDRRFKLINKHLCQDKRMREARKLKHKYWMLLEEVDN